MPNGVSVDLFTDFMAVLVKRHGDKLVDQEFFNEAVRVLGDLDRCYASLSNYPEEKTDGR